MVSKSQDDLGIVRIHHTLRLSLAGLNVSIHETESQIERLYNCLVLSITALNIPAASDDFVVHLENLIEATKIERIHTMEDRHYRLSREISGA